MSHNIALLGMMGSGKTTVARRLGDTLGRGVIDTDDEIADRVGAGIPAIFAERGEAGFRALEREVIEDVARADDWVVALGGGAVLDDANVATLLLTGVLVELRADHDTLVGRLRRGAARRPLLQGHDLDQRVAAMLTERGPRYGDVADISIDASGEVDDVVVRILSWLVTTTDVLTPSEHEQVMA